MVAKRIIPCLDVDEGRVVKGIAFKGIRDAGDPVEMARQYNRQQADELVFLDIGASYKSKTTMLQVVEQISREVFIPLTVGGGIRTVEDMRAALIAGADKVSMCTAALQNPQMLREGAERFGSQCVVLSIDAKREDGDYYAYTHGGRKNSGKTARAWAQEAERLGAGEILLNSIDQDGSQEGYDINLLQQIGKAVSIPVIASGGAGNVAHVLQAIRTGGADAVLLASLLHFGELTVQEIKSFLQKHEVSVRW